MLEHKQRDISIMTYDLLVQETVDLRWMMGGVGPSLIYGGGAAKAAATNKDARVTLENMTTD